MKSNTPNYDKEVFDIINKLILFIKEFKKVSNKNKYTYILLFYRLKSRLNNLKYYCDNYYKYIAMSDTLADLIGMSEQKIQYFDYYSLKIEDVQDNIDYMLSSLENLLT
ncbi:hypothetical protein [Fluviispira sanaruensis]|uniref:Uncharacterized protein n=1 Tax=Fluviispira sanaruensis TaxID=2493639 RepID=A0A4P2VMV5_FLUSA|nr:hypothetical protein [Fluviispira sanaruensis]BBH54753.1 hypothetical protein JCM31447_32270 [Fluviispira sanaruensis]